MIAWLLDTLVATAALIALVLVIRRPVARLFGPGLAYALWALPLVRLALPPLLLPAVAPTSESLALDPPVAIVASGGTTAPAAAAFDWSPLLALLPWLWLAGALAFIAWRRVDYVRMRERLLCGARPMGEAGRVRIVESPSVTVPVAFGVLDPVIALPPQFLASPDRRARDLALAHELEHHAAHDLAANMAMQALLALHWFNPLAWIGWRAMRRDQEAACDARVIAGRDGTFRAEYARLIASFAGGPRLALAASIGAPFGLGEKSVIHRLRTLSQPAPSTARRRAGIAVVLAGLLALPLTATVSYASAEPPTAKAPQATPAKPVEKKVVRRITVRRDEAGKPDADTSQLHTRRIERDGKTIVLRSNREISDKELESRLERLDEELEERIEAQLEARLEAAGEARARTIEAAMEARAEALEQAGHARAEALEAAAEARAHALEAAAEARAEALEAAAEARAHAAEAQRLAREAERLGREAERVAREHAAALRAISLREDACESERKPAQRTVHT